MRNTDLSVLMPQNASPRDRDRITSSQLKEREEDKKGQQWMSPVERRQSLEPAHKNNEKAGSSFNVKRTFTPKPYVVNYKTVKSSVFGYVSFDPKVGEQFILRRQVARCTSTINESVSFLSRDFAAIARRFRGDCAVIVCTASSDFAVTAQRLRSDVTVISK
jgi:hypothetical protein